MSYYEKINIYVPAKIKQQIDNDARLFEILKNDHKTINRNRFLTLVLVGYYKFYTQENQQAYDAIYGILSSSTLSCSKVEELSRRIMNEVFPPTIPKRKGKKPEHLSFKPTEETAGIIDDIQKRSGAADYISQFLCRLLVSFCNKPMPEREKILFRDRFEAIADAIDNRRMISFSSIWDDTKRHDVSPFTIASSQEEMYNYLVCVENDMKTGRPIVRSYRVNRITKILGGPKAPALCDELRHLCERTASISPQYAINSDTEICVKLNETGMRLYNRIYYGRPEIDHIVNHNGYYLCFFRCSLDQVFHYFRRFGNQTAEIISPLSEREHMINFHRGALDTYCLIEE